MSAKVISYKKFKEQAPPDISFLRGFCNENDRSEVFRTRQWVAKLLKDIELPVDEYNKGVDMLRKVYQLASNPNIKHLYDKLDCEKIKNSLPYLNNPIRNGVVAELPVVQKTSEGSFCSFQTNPNYRREGFAHRQIHLDLETIAIFSKVIQNNTHVDIYSIDEYFYVTLRAIYAFEEAHSTQIKIELFYDQISSIYHSNVITPEVDAVTLFMRRLAYDLNATKDMKADRRKLDSENNTNYMKEIENLSLLLLTDYVVKSVNSMIRFKELPVFQFKLKVGR